jgi:hypothetical protein
MSDSDLDVQGKIEKELFEEYDKVLDRIFSLTKFIFVIIGFFAVILYDIHGKLDKSIFVNAPDPLISTISVISSFLSMSVVIVYLFTTLVSKRIYKFEEVNHLIQYRKGNELRINNLKLFSEIKKMNGRYTSAIYLIALSLVLFCSYIKPELFYQILIFIIIPAGALVFKLVSKIIKFIKLSVS